MKNKRMVFGLLLIMTGVIIMGNLTGCDTGTNGNSNNTSPKKLKIEGVTTPTLLQVGIFPLGTTKEQALLQTSMIAAVGGAEALEETKNLYSGGDTLWTGSGTYDVFLLIDGTSSYVKRNATFSETVTTIPFSEFTTI
jgi:hypothetical protein